ncbi:Co2+/Mg2+ efflux protein ApaG [Mongoliitalea daihaiensis]|uniref:Co2+/Mg2+ efflux protein ApaG n=1 Tax=Mongoliitalea daihaiensis TaxID=2782006 RepID=UPI001F2BDDF1|nr:Co2+/Mg2+ efflux protein ApaG [Mongoliitalea daihaiensis]UJP64494.1 Co2+/Mg2+ efflux protein ApaG [Mongoliitalea daihaiensis]
MVSATTEGVQVTVETTYQADFSNPQQHHFVFTYKVTIENKSDSTVKLLKRHWEIHDAGDQLKIVQGDGVVGRKPTLEPGQLHEYVSGCNLKSGLGKMSGTYLMEVIKTGKLIEVEIPEFQLIATVFNN